MDNRVTQATDLLPSLTGREGSGLELLFLIGDLNQLVTTLNESFDNCVVSDFAHFYLGE